MKRNLLVGIGAAALGLVILPISAAAAGPGPGGPGPGGPGPGAPGPGGPGLMGHPGPHPGHPAPGAAVVNIANGPYGPVLVVGGPGAGLIPSAPTTPPTPPTPPSYAYPAGSSLYFATVDPPATGAGPAHQYQAACTTTVVNDTLEGPLSCTGPIGDPTADWPAFTTTAFPVAGPGVNPRLLNAVYRPDLGTFQVTYAGHPLYLFDPGPSSFFGADFFESALPLPPWNTMWYLMAPNGTPASGPATVQTESPQDGTAYNSTVLATIVLPTIVPGGVAVSVYTFSGDRPNMSTCYDACARTFIPLYTVGTPIVGPGANGGAIGVIHRTDGSNQVTYNGQPLYIYSAEQPLVGMGGPITDGSAGNGNGVTGFGGTLNLVSP